MSDETLPQLVERLRGLQKAAHSPADLSRREKAAVAYADAIIDAFPRLIEAAELLTEIAASGVEQETRGYVTVQIDRETWEKVRQS